jgi:fermentation-respiration switch protein FrsA (DUF1100 family)
MRHDVTFLSKGLKCSGWLYLPDDLAPGDRRPAVIMAHGFSGTKDLYLSNYAEPFATAGFVTLAFDYRYMGESEGEPRCQQFPWDNQEDYRNAISWLSRQPQVDPERIGLWGTSYSGTHVIQVAAFDRRVKAVVSQACGTLGGLDAFGALLGREGLDRLLVTLLEARLAAYPDGPIPYLPVVAAPGQPATMNDPGMYEFFTRAQAECPHWENRITTETVEKMFEADLTMARMLVAPTPVLVVTCTHDAMIPLGLVYEKMATMSEPKKLVELDCAHHEIYNTQPYLGQAIEVEIAWFKEHLQ